MIKNEFLTDCPGSEVLLARDISFLLLKEWFYVNCDQPYYSSQFPELVALSVERLDGDGIVLCDSIQWNNGLISFGSAF